MNAKRYAPDKHAHSLKAFLDGYMEGLDDLPDGAFQAACEEAVAIYSETFSIALDGTDGYVEYARLCAEEREDEAAAGLSRSDASRYALLRKFLDVRPSGEIVCLMTAPMDENGDPLGLDATVDRIIARQKERV